MTEAGRPAFQLRKGEDGISVFDQEAVEPPLTEAEILEGFKPGCMIVTISIQKIEAKSLRVVRVPGAEPLSSRLQAAHMEIHPGPGMPRGQFKQVLKELE
ncbi:MAG: hypothetical protein HY000_18785 [Planctomycetes bacterium]|nr:hypothetical protein [Planctomycetota bacterium]